jgi:3,4-dihydroxy 2-butanone 4-phosphate synthase/GTP cyclohydrolase II
MVENNTDSLKTAYTVSIDAKGTTTGISSRDRATTINLLADPNVKKGDFNMPGHVFPLRAVDGGVLERVGHTEASVDLCVLAGMRPVAAISEVVLDEGGMMRRDDLVKFCKEFGLKLITINDLVKYRLRHQ